MAGFCKLLVASLPLVVAILIYLYPTISDRVDSSFGYTAPTYDVPVHILELFRSHDGNGDDALDPYEFFDFIAKLPHQGLQIPDNVLKSFEAFEFRDEYLNHGGHVLLVEAQIEPLEISSMTKFTENGLDSPRKMENDQQMPGLLQWTTPDLPLREYGTANFRLFYPPDDDDDVGVVYNVIEDVGERSGVHLYSYHPPTPNPNELLLQALMSQLHINPYVYTRFGPRGTKAVVRAKNGHLLDIIIRSHIEFQLNTSPNYPFWFTPAQLSGRLVVNRTSDEILYFKMSLPTDNQLNVDMEWLVGASGANEVDIGYCPKLQIESVGASYEYVTHGEMISPQYVNLKKLKWSQEIKMSNAISLLEKSFFPFKQVPYLPFLDAVSIAKTENKLVHLIMLWGALDDQSC